MAGLILTKLTGKSPLSPFRVPSHQPSSTCVCISGWVCIDPVMLIMGETEKRKSRCTELPLKLEPTLFQRGYSDTPHTGRYQPDHYIQYHLQDTLHTKLNTVTIEKKPGSLNSEATHITHCHNILNDIPYHQRQLTILSFRKRKKNFCRCLEKQHLMCIRKNNIIIQHKQIQ